MRRVTAKLAMVRGDVVQGVVLLVLEVPQRLIHDTVETWRCRGCKVELQVERPMMWIHVAVCPKAKELDGPRAELVSRIVPCVPCEGYGLRYLCLPIGKRFVPVGAGMVEKWTLYDETPCGACKGTGGTDVARCRTCQRRGYHLVWCAEGGAVQVPFRELAMRELEKMETELARRKRGRDHKPPVQRRRRRTDPGEPGPN